MSSTVVALILLYSFFPPSLDTEFADAALGADTVTVPGYLDGDRVHCSNLTDAEQCLGPAQVRALDRSVLWLGNSQLHAINQAKPEDVPGSVMAAQGLRPHGVEFLTFSQPNANLAEHLILFEALSKDYSFDMLLLPVVFDDMREQSLRPDIEKILIDPGVAAGLKATEFGRELLKNTKPAKETEMATLQERAENIITALLDECCDWEKLRKQARGNIGLFLYRSRNYIFGIKPSSVRRMIPAAYRQNMAAYEAILASAREKDVRVLVYIPPLRSDVQPPYKIEEYIGFKGTIEASSAEYGANFINLENIVPGPLWGMKESTSLGGQPEYDFMHFQEAGHALLAEHIVAEILKEQDDL